MYSQYVQNTSHNIFDCDFFLRISQVFFRRDFSKGLVRFYLVLQIEYNLSAYLFVGDRSQELASRSFGRGKAGTLNAHSQCLNKTRHTKIAIKKTNNFVKTPLLNIPLGDVVQLRHVCAPILLAIN